MAEIFKKEIMVTEPECDVSRRIRISQLMRHAQQIGSDHLLYKQIDPKEMFEAGMVFLVSKLRIDVRRRPTFGEKLVLTTVPKEPKGAQFIRATRFETVAGEFLAEASIAWLLADPNTHKILRPSAFNVYGFTMNPNDGESITSYRIRRPEGEGTYHLRQIKYADLDHNRHVNNAAYADIVCDALPLRELLYNEVESFGIMFHHEATEGQVLDLEVIPEGRGYYIGGLVFGKSCFEAEIFFQKRCAEQEEQVV